MVKANNTSQLDCSKTFLASSIVVPVVTKSSTKITFIFSLPLYTKSLLFFLRNFKSFPAYLMIFVALSVLNTGNICFDFNFF